jgi:hypothetical protein
MAIDYAAIAAAGGIGKGRPRVLAALLKDRGHKIRLDAAYALVDHREDGRDRVTGKPTVKGGKSHEVLRDHHHLYGRNARPEFKFDHTKIISVSRRTHKYLQQHLIEVEGDNADGVLFFRWDRSRLPGGKIPFRILARSAPFRKAA